MTIISLSCLVCLPQPTPDGRFSPQTTKSVLVYVGKLDFIFPCKIEDVENFLLLKSGKELHKLLPNRGCLFCN